MKTKNNRDTGRSYNASYENSYNRMNREDDERRYPQDRNYDYYDKDNRLSSESDYNAFDRTYTPGGYRRANEQYNRQGSGYSSPERFREDTSFRNEGHERSEGYRGRSSEDYDHRAPYWNDYYNAADNYSRNDGRGYTYRHDEDYEREERNPGPQGYYSWGRQEVDRSKGDYGYYESYPSYGQSEAYGDHERYTGKTAGHRSNTDQYGETDYTDNRRKRPNARDRFSW